MAARKLDHSCFVVPSWVRPSLSGFDNQKLLAIQWELTGEHETCLIRHAFLNHVPMTNDQLRVLMRHLGLATASGRTGNQVAAMDMAVRIANKVLEDKSAVEQIAAARAILETVPGGDVADAVLPLVLANLAKDCPDTYKDFEVLHTAVTQGQRVAKVVMDMAVEPPKDTVERRPAQQQTDVRFKAT